MGSSLAYDGLVELPNNANAAGRLRPDRVPEDPVMLLMDNAGVVSATAVNVPRMTSLRRPGQVPRASISFFSESVSACTCFFSVFFARTRALSIRA